MVKLMIGTPAYSGKVHVPYAISLSETVLQLMSGGIQVFYNLTTSGSLLIAERNKILHAFMESDCTHLLCADSDLGWENCILKMLMADKEIIAGVYPRRAEKVFDFRPCLNCDGSLITENGLIKVDYIPSGFMLIQRSALEKMRSRHPDLYYQSKDPDQKDGKGWLFFNCELYEGEFWGEDYTFCRKARQSGVEIWVDPAIRFDHSGNAGMLLEILHRTETKFDDENVVSGSVGCNT